MSKLYNTRIVWRHVPDDKKQRLLTWLTKLQSDKIGNIKFTRERSGKIIQVTGNFSTNAKTYLIEHTSVNAIISV